MPTSRIGVRAPSTTFIKHGETRRDRRGGPCTAMPDPQTQTVGTVGVAEESIHESKCPSSRFCQPILRLDAFDHASSVWSILNACAKSPVQDSQIQDWSKVTTFLGYNEVRAVKPLPHLSWRGRLDCILCQEDSNLLAQDRGLPDCHRSLENAVELGRSQNQSLCAAPASTPGWYYPRAPVWVPWLGEPAG